MARISKRRYLYELAKDTLKQIRLSEAAVEKGEKRKDGLPIIKVTQGSGYLKSSSYYSSETDFQTFLKKEQPTCEVCMDGALLLCDVLRTDQFSTKDGLNLNADNTPLIDKLAPKIGYDMLVILEAVFEGASIRNVTWYPLRGTESEKTAIKKHREAAIEYGFDLKVSGMPRSKVAKIILRNIIRNGGDFVIPAKYYYNN